MQAQQGKLHHQGSNDGAHLTFRVLHVRATSYHVAVLVFDNTAVLPYCNTSGIITMHISVAAYVANHNAVNHPTLSPDPSRD